jgi:hypothetical protein
VNITPPLPTHNHYACLFIDNMVNTSANDYDCDEDVNDKSTDSARSSAKSSLSPTPPCPCSPPKKKWEKCLPKQYVIAASPSPNSLDLDIEIETTDTGIKRAVKALVDCGATGQFMDKNWARSNKITTCPLPHPIPMYNVDGTPNEAGRIDEIADVVLCYDGHAECTQFAITQLGKQSMILSFTWLREHNPEIDWQTKEVCMSRCPSSCTTCYLENKKKHRIQCAKSHKIRACRSSGFPVLIEDVNDEDDPHHKGVADLKGGVNSAIPSISSRWMPDLIDVYDDDEIEEGDRIFMVNIHPEDDQHFV